MRILRSRWYNGRKVFPGGIGLVTEFRNSSGRFLRSECNLVRAGIRGSYSRRERKEKGRKQEEYPSCAVMTGRRNCDKGVLTRMAALRALASSSQKHLPVYSQNNFLFCTFFRKINFRCILVRKNIFFCTSIQLFAKLFRFKGNNYDPKEIIRPHFWMRHL